MREFGCTVEIEVISGLRYEYTNKSADSYRLNQMNGVWLPAGMVCCYLGISLGTFGETQSVRLHWTPRERN